MTLMLAFKQLAKYLATVRPHSHAQAPLNDATITESIIFILGWFQSIKAKKATHDLITGSLLWYIHEKRNFSVASFGKDGGYPILGRLPKVLLRLESLEAEIRKLGDVLNGDEKTKNKTIILDQVMSAFIEDKDESGGINFRELLSQCIEIVGSNKKTVKSTVIDGQILSEEEDDSEEEDIHGDGITLTGKRQRQRFAPVRKSRRVSLRSRNETIDNWLTLDDDHFGSTPGEKYNVDDGFVDLEDFLVEG